MDQRNFHIDMRLTVNESKWSYNSPNAFEEFDITIPIEMYNGTSFIKMVEKSIQNLVENFPAKKLAWQAEQAEEAREAEQAEAEAEAEAKAEAKAEAEAELEGEGE
jgi:hypothetical protein